MKQYTIYCTPEQARKALGLGAPIEYKLKGTCKTPTAEQMIGWLEEQGLHFDFEFITITCCMVQHNGTYLCNPFTGTRKEATLAAIDAALEYLSQTKVSPN